MIMSLHSRAAAFSRGCAQASPAVVTLLMVFPRTDVGRHAQLTQKGLSSAVLLPLEVRCIFSLRCFRLLRGLEQFQLSRSLPI